MVCYARRATWMSGVTVGVILVSGQATLHLLNVTALAVAMSAVFGGSTLLAGIFYLSFRAVRKKRALAGGCVGCRFTCQHAMTDFAGSPAATRSWLVRTIDRDAAAPAVMLPMPSWPDRPVMHAPAAPEKEQVRVPVAAR